MGEQKQNGAALGINLALQSDDGRKYGYEDVCELLESSHVSGFTALPTPGIGGEADAAQREPNARINCYYDSASDLPFDEFLRRAGALIGLLCDRFCQRAVGYELFWVAEDGQRQVSGVAARGHPIDLINLVRMAAASPSEVKVVERTLVVALHEGAGSALNRMLFYTSPDWGGRVLVPSLKINQAHPYADDPAFLLRAFCSKLPVDNLPLETMTLMLLPGGPKSDRFKFSLDRTRRWEGVKRYVWRVAWINVADAVAAKFPPHAGVTNALAVEEVFGWSTLRAVKRDHRNLAANWDVIHCLEDLFGGDLEIVPPNPNR